MCAWVAPVRGHIAQRDQHECAILQAGVRQDQFTWGNAALIRGWQRLPVGLRLDIGQHQVAKGQKIQVQGSAGPTGGSGAPKRSLYPMQLIQQCLCRGWRVIRGAVMIGPDHCIDIVWP